MDVVEQVNNRQHRSKYTQYKQTKTNRQISSSCSFQQILL